MRRGIVTSGATLALGAFALSAAPASAEPVRMCDGNRGVIAKGIGCAEAFWLSDHARAGAQVAGWSVRGNSAGVVRLRRGSAWVKLRRVPLESVAALSIAGLRLTHSFDDGELYGYDEMAFCPLRRVDFLVSDTTHGQPPVQTDGSAPQSGTSSTASVSTRGSWAPLFISEWRGGRTIELRASFRSAPFRGRSPAALALGATDRLRLELRDDGTGTLTSPASRVPVRWKRLSKCPVRNG